MPTTAHELDVVALERLYEGFRHAVGLRAADGGGQWFQADLPRKRTRVARNVREPLSVSHSMGWSGGAPPKRASTASTMRSHQVASDAAGGCHPAHRFPITAIQRKGDPHPFAIVTGDLEAVRAPTPITSAYRDTAVMAARVKRASGVSLKQQPILPHDAVDVLMVDPLSSGVLTPPIDQRPGASVAIGRQCSDLTRDLGHKFAVITRPTVTAAIGPVRRNGVPVRADWSALKPRTSQTVFTDRPRATGASAQSIFVHAPPLRLP